MFKKYGSISGYLDLKSRYAHPNPDLTDPRFYYLDPCTSDIIFSDRVRSRIGSESWIINPSPNKKNINIIILVKSFKLTLTKKNKYSLINL